MDSAGAGVAVGTGVAVGAGVAAVDSDEELSVDSLWLVAALSRGLRAAGCGTQRNGSSQGNRQRACFKIIFAHGEKVSFLMNIPI